MIEQKMNACSQPKGLDAEALAAITVLARLGEPDRRKAVHALGYTEMRRIWTPRDPKSLPSLTRLVPERDRSAIYASPEWAAYRRDRTVVVYILQTCGLAVLSSRLGGTSLCKVGSTTIENLSRRVADLGSAEYGAWIRGSRRYERAEGFNNYEPAPRLQLAVQDPASPVRLSSVGIEIDLPRGRMTPDEFEAALNRRLLPIRLQSIADSATGRELCARTGVDPRELRRFYQRGTGFRAATELTALRPQADTGALGRLCSDIVIDVVLGLDAQRPVR